MTARRLLGIGYIALFSAVLAAQTPAQKGSQDEEFLKGAYSVGNGVQAPKVIKNIVPKYTSEAMRAKLQGDVEVQIVVGIDGKVDRARVVTSLDKVYGLDESALDAIKQWTFEPGTLQGKAVPVAVKTRLTFKLH